MVRRPRRGGARRPVDHVRRLALALIAGALPLVTSAAIPASVAAHDGAARLDLDPVVVPAGGVVLVRGVELGGDGPVPLRLVDAARGEVPLGTATSDAAGEFALAVTVPVTVPIGAYVVRAIAPDGDPVEASIRVDPPRFDAAAPPGQDEPILAPGGSVTGAAATGRPSGATGQPLAAPASTGTSPGSEPIDPFPFVAAILAVAALAFLVARSRRSTTAR